MEDRSAQPQSPIKLRAMPGWQSVKETDRGAAASAVRCQARARREGEGMSASVKSNTSTSTSFTTAASSTNFRATASQWNRIA